MRKVMTRPPSFPQIQPDIPLSSLPGERWQVLCGDQNHWRVGVYSPSDSNAAQITELEKHDCPELFLLMTGRVVLVIAENSGTREIELEPGKPVLVQSPHSGYCPDGPHTGTAFVVERDAFDTEYRTAKEWTQEP